MPFITVLNQRRYVGKEQGSLVKLQLGVNDWITKKRNKNETDEDMESRVTAELLKEMQSRAAASTAAEMLRGEVPCSASHESRRFVSPAPSRPIREPGGVKGKPSPSNPDSEVRMMPPPPPKRPATRGERAVARQLRLPDQALCQQHPSAPTCTATIKHQWGP